MDKVLKAISNFFKKIWEWVKNTAWVQPVLIVSLIFAVIFSINPIIKGVKSALNSGNKDGAFYKAHSKDFTEKNFLALNNEECIAIFVNLEDSGKETAGYKDNDKKEKERIETLIDTRIHDTYADLYNYNLPTDKFNYDIKYSGWDSNGENEYLQGNFDKTLNNPTFVKYKDGKPIDIRFDLSSYKDKNDKPINEVTVLVDLWNGGNKN